MKRREFFNKTVAAIVWIIIEKNFLYAPWSALNLLEKSEREKNLIKDFLTPDKEIILSQEEGEKILKEIWSALKEEMIWYFYPKKNRWINATKLTIGSHGVTATKNKYEEESYISYHPHFYREILLFKQEEKVGKIQIEPNIKNPNNMVLQISDNTSRIMIKIPSEIIFQTIHPALPSPPDIIILSKDPNLQQIKIFTSTHIYTFRKNKTLDDIAKQIYSNNKDTLVEELIKEGYKENEILEIIKDYYIYRLKQILGEYEKQIMDDPNIPEILENLIRNNVPDNNPNFQFDEVIPSAYLMSHSRLEEIEYLVNNYFNSNKLTKGMFEFSIKSY